MTKESKPIIKVEGLSKKFKDFTAVDNISFVVKKGEIFAFLGPNGAGKTTTIKMLTTLLDPTTGKIHINGFNSNQKDEIRNSFGIVFQDPSLDDELTAKENMEFHAALYKVPKKGLNEKIDHLLTLVELLDRKNSLVKTFSGGMKRRLEIARALIHEPKILFLDEPTIGLDPQTRNQMWSYVQNLNKKNLMTVFFTTHYMEEAEKISDKISIIDHGKIVMSGTVPEIKKETKTSTIEEAFLQLTGHSIREEQASSMDNMRTAKKMWGKR